MPLPEQYRSAITENGAFEGVADASVMTGSRPTQLAQANHLLVVAERIRVRNPTI